MNMALKQIRKQIGHSISNMATTLAINKATYQGYENGSRATPDEIMQLAQLRLKQSRDYWNGKNMTKRMDEAGT